MCDETYDQVGRDWDVAYNATYQFKARRGVVETGLVRIFSQTSFELVFGNPPPPPPTERPSILES